MICVFSAKEEAMQSLNKKAAPDRSKINMHEPLEVKYWTRKLSVDKLQLQKLVDKVGNSAATVRKELAVQNLNRCSEVGRKLPSGSFANGPTGPRDPDRLSGSPVVRCFPCR
jgi:hypothetical protein